MLDNFMTGKNYLQYKPLSTHSTSNEESANNCPHLDSFLKHQDDQHHNLDLGFDDDDDYDSESGAEEDQDSGKGGDQIDEEDEEDGEDDSGEEYSDEEDDEDQDEEQDLQIPHPTAPTARALTTGEHQGGQMSQDLDCIEEPEVQVEMDLTKNHHEHFYKEFCRLQMTHAMLGSALQGLLQRQKGLREALTQSETMQTKHETALDLQFEVNDEKRKRNRRNAGAIARQFQCPVPNCSKSYGMEGTLTQHIKIKHRDFYNRIVEHCQMKKEGQTDGPSQNKEEYSFKGF